MASLVSDNESNSGDSNSENSVDSLGEDMRPLLREARRKRAFRGVVISLICTTVACTLFIGVSFLFPRQKESDLVDQSGSIADGSDDSVTYLFDDPSGEEMMDSVDDYPEGWFDLELLPTEVEAGATQPVEVQGDTVTGSSQGVEVSMTPASIALCAEEPFGIEYVIRIGEDVSPELESLEIERAPRLVGNAMHVLTDDVFNWSEVLLSAPDNVTVELGDTEYYVKGFKPGDEIKIAAYGTTDVGWTRNEGVKDFEVRVLGNFPSRLNNDVSFDEAEELFYLHGEVFIDDSENLTYDSMNESNLNTDTDNLYSDDGGFSDEIKAKIDEALEKARAEAQTPEERIDIFREELRLLHVFFDLTLSPEGELSVEAPDGSVAIVNLNPEYDSAGGLYTNP